jgi:predicted RNA binding protein YcfA (HicA-like mRNA interferase family)
MARLPVVSGAECVAALRRIGYEVMRTKGSHAFMACVWRGSHPRLTGVGRSPVVVPLHDELDRGTLRSIIRILDLTVDEFLEILRGDF